MANAHIKAIITADDRASKIVSQFGNNTNKVAKGVATGLLTVGVAAAAVTAGVVAFGVSAVKSFRESEDATARLQAGINNVKTASDKSISVLTKQAEALQKVTRFSDEQIVSGQAMLTTFQLNQGTIKALTPSMLNMAEAMRRSTGETIDLEQTALLMGKVMGNAAGGVDGLAGALKKSGVVMTEAQKQIFSTGTEAERTATLVQIMNDNFGGFAEAGGKTFSGQLDILKNQFDEIKESIGGVIVGALQPLVERLSNFVATEEFRLKVEALTTWLEQNLPRIIAQIEEMVKKFIEWAQSVEWQKVIQNVIAIINAFAWLVGQVTGAWANIRNAQEKVVTALGGSVFLWQAIIGQIVTAFRQARAGIVKDLNTIKDFIGSIPGWVRGAFRGLAVGMISPFATAFTSIVSLWNNTVGRISFKFPDWVPGLGGKSVAVPKFASGTSFAPGGIATVGEQGAEQVYLPRGSQVVPNNSVRDGGGGTTINVTVQAGAYMGNQQDARRYAQMIADALKDVAAMKGTTVMGVLS